MLHNIFNRFECRFNDIGLSHSNFFLGIIQDYKIIGFVVGGHLNNSFVYCRIVHKNIWFTLRVCWSVISWCKSGIISFINDCVAKLNIVIRTRLLSFPIIRRTASDPWAITVILKGSSRVSFVRSLWIWTLLNIRFVFTIRAKWLYICVLFAVWNRTRWFCSCILFVSFIGAWGIRSYILFIARIRTGWLCSCILFVSWSRARGLCSCILFAALN